MPLPAGSCPLHAAVAYYTRQLPTTRGSCLLHAAVAYYTRQLPTTRSSCPLHAAEFLDVNNPIKLVRHSSVEAGK